MIVPMRVESRGPGGIRKPKFTIKDRIIAHLAEFPSERGRPRVSAEISQQGIAEAVGILSRHIQQYVRPLVIEGLVTELKGYIDGGRQRQKVYFLTSQGKTEAFCLKRDYSLVGPPIISPLPSEVQKALGVLPSLE
jgi:DNA-binding MarR family transcriptional regulator